MQTKLDCCAARTEGYRLSYISAVTKVLLVSITWAALHVFWSQASSRYCGDCALLQENQSKVQRQVQQMHGKLDEQNEEIQKLKAQQQRQASQPNASAACHNEQGSGSRAGPTGRALEPQQQGQDRSQASRKLPEATSIIRSSCWHCCMKLNPL